MKGVSSNGDRFFLSVQSGPAVVSAFARADLVRIAIACSGLGRVRRGFETFAQDLYQHLTLSSNVEVTLLKGGGDAVRGEVKVWNVHRRSPVWLLTRPWLDPYIGEQMTFALSLARQLKRNAFDIVHLSDSQVAASLRHLFPGFSRRFRLLYSNGGPMEPRHYYRYDFVHQVNPVELDRASTYGFPVERMALVPYGISPGRFQGEDGSQVRISFGIRENVPLILTVGAHGAHKRIDFAIRCAALADGDAHLLVLGEPSEDETPSLRALGARLLGRRIHFAVLPYDKMPRAYASADIYVHAALSEGFGFALLEAMASGLPILHHNEPAMNWMVSDGGLATDMTDESAASDALRTLVTNSDIRSRLSGRARSRAAEVFSWKALLPRYLEMYNRVLRLPPKE